MAPMGNHKTLDRPLCLGNGDAQSKALNSRGRER